MLALALLAAGLVLGLFAVTAPAPRPAPGLELTVADMARGRQVWHALGLKALREGQEKTLRLSTRDLNLGLDYLARRAGLAGAAARIEGGALVAGASLRVPGLPLRRYLNVELTLAQDGPRLRPERLRAGALPLPAGLAAGLLDWGLAHTPLAPQYAAARDMLRGARLDADALELDIVWRGQALAAAVGEGMGLDGAAVEAYRRHLAAQPPGEFAALLGEAFALAERRSRGGDPVLENRAALAALAEKVLGTRLDSAASLAAIRWHGGGGPTRLAGRADFAQHFAFSALLAAAGGGRLSELAGLYKELDDAREGSGFSFNDLAADRAGSRFGEAATRSEREARRVQESLAGTRSSAAYFPRVDDLPQFMGEAEFARRFGGIGAPAYREMEARIKARIEALDLYRRD